MTAERRGNSLERCDDGCEAATMSAIQVHRVTPDRPDLLEAMAAVRTVTDHEINPDDPPAPMEELAADLFVESVAVRHAGWVAHLDGRPAGELTVSVDKSEENAHLLDVEWLAVDPSLRRRGVADALLRAGLDWAVAEGRTSVVLWAPTLPTGRAYAERCRCTLRLEERCSRLVVADLDHDQQDEWRRSGRERTDGYRVVQWVGPVPDEHVDALVAAHRAMEDMPTDDLEWTIPAMTPERLQSRDEAWERGGRCNVSTLALASDGSAAGLSELQINTHRPQLASQGDTGVVEAHRGHGLGRWLKAENLRLALDTEPRIRIVETYNAESNPWMLDINVAMGFRPHIGYQAFQGDVAEARQALG
jgi:mycothiol synthase